MTDPKRLVDDPETQEDLRADLLRVRNAPFPSYDVERGVERFLAGGALAKEGASLAVKGSLVMKIGAALVVLGGAGTALVLGAHRGERGQVGESSSAQVVEPSVKDAPPEGTVAPTPSEVSTAKVMDPPAVDPAALRDTPRRDDPVRPSAKPIKGHHPPPPPRTEDTAAADDRVAREVALLGQARSALSDDPARALALTQEGDRDFPSGVLREEREAIAVLALVRLGRKGAAAERGRTFLARYPSGPFSERVRIALGPLAPHAP